MYEAILGASSSVSVLAWQINLDVGMVPTARAAPFMLAAIGVDPSAASLLTLEDLLIWKAMCGVLVRVVVWRHQLISRLEKLLPISEGGSWNLHRTLRKFKL